ncbi:MAG: choloylglycine hydrolase [Oscillospiraceae bacterium]|nr:choloylglycine hydrolase [Oscillospiraceae bacterium]
MCTAICQGRYFGRNLDLEYGYQESVTVTPRNSPFRFRKMPPMDTHYAMIGMATVVDNCPLYYEATNEKGLSMAGLNFPRNAKCLPVRSGADNVAPFEFIPWILGQCDSVAQARPLLQKLNLADIHFSEQLPLSPLHWIIADQQESIVVEPMADGIRVFENPIGVLTNEPPFDFHLYHLSNYMNVSIHPAANRFSEGYEPKPYSNGMGGIGLPGDYSSSSRFVRAAFVKLNSRCDGDDLGQFFHILESVSMPRGCVRMHDGRYEITRYSCCCDSELGIYYYTTYTNSQINGIDMHQENLEGSMPISYPLMLSPQIFMQNQKKDGMTP